jgi:hypothetical protein
MSLKEGTTSPSPAAALIRVRASTQRLMSISALR